MTKHYPLVIKALIASLIFHYLFINYFPVDWLERLSLFSENQQQDFIITSKIEVSLVGEEGEPGFSEQSMQQEGNGQAEGDQGGGLTGIDQEKWGDLLSRLEENTGFKGEYSESHDNIIQNSNVSERYINRERHHEDIVVKDVFPTIHNIDKAFEDVLKAAPEKLTEYVERNEIIEQFRSQDSSSQVDLTIESLTTTESGDLGPLSFPASEREKFFDSTLANDKTSQLSDFIRKYFSYDPNEGDLPIATRELYLKNLERLLYKFSSDPSYFHLDFFLENLNKEDFLHNALDQATKLQGSKTATELLFSVERIYEIQQRAWKTYFEFDASYADIPEARKEKLRVETLRRVNERYKEVLQKKGIEDFSDLEKKYLQRRYEIMEYIIKHTPDNYRLQDALFEQAAILWKMGITNNDKKVKERAIAQWQTIITEAKANNFSQDAYEDFLNLEHLRVLEALIYVYQREGDANKAMREKRISTFLLQRQNERLAKKQKREERLLWPRDN